MPDREARYLPLTDEQRKMILEMDETWEMLRQAAWKRLLEVFGPEVEHRHEHYFGESPILSALRGPVYGTSAKQLGIPRQEPRLGALPIITSDETEGHYGTSGDLDPRGYWMPIDGETS